MPFHPYLTFDGTCREAFTRYQEIFGGELFLMPISEAPGAPADSDRLAHASLSAGDLLLMASDAPEGGHDEPQGVFVAYTLADVDEATRVFAELADGGEVQVPIGPSFFSPAYGQCLDRFGTPWMIVADQPEA